MYRKERNRRISAGKIYGEFELALLKQRGTSLFTEPTVCFYISSRARMEIKAAGDLLTSSARGRVGIVKKSY